jgi:formylglycine-generating enzyme required for sulfatase activity
LTKSDGHTYRLPDENEWEAAAAGKEGREYPWGNGWKESCCNSEESKIGKTSSVGIFKIGETPEGIADMAGNVWEWTASDYHLGKQLKDFRFEEEIQRLWEEVLRTQDKKKIDEYFEKLREKSRQLPVLRGGSWLINPEYARCTYRFRSDPGDRDASAGFRCARDAK